MKSISGLFKAFTDDSRLRIVGLLSEGELCVCDLVAALKMPQSTVSRHLTVLRNAGVVLDRRCKTWTYYRLSEEMTPFAREILASLTSHLASLLQTQKDISALHAYRNGSDRNCEQPPKRGGKA